MALAYLAHHHAPRSIQSKIIALVVDHQLRPESFQEAERVSKNLEFIGISSHILRLPHLKDEIKPDKSNLESRARDARFKALGIECARRGIRHLLLGHHKDDGYEMAIQRLSLSQRAEYQFSMSTGPTPIPVPRSEGYGLVSSGKPKDLDFLDFGQHTGIKGFEQGGVFILHPLLHLEKSQLVQLCRTKFIPWVEDPSNADATLTGRNAIRSIVATSDLPRALQRASMVKMITTIDELLQVYRAMAHDLFDICQLKFDPGLGLLYARLPTWKTIIDQCRANESRPLKNHSFLAALLLRKFVDIVSMNSTNSLQNIIPAVEYVYPRSSGFRIRISAVQTAGTHITWHYIRKTKIGQTLPWLSTEQTAKTVDLDSEIYFAFSRSGLASRWFSNPYTMRLAEDSKASSPVSGNHLMRRILPSVPNDNADSAELNFNPEIFDQKFWISVNSQHEEDDHVWIRPLLPEHLDQIRSLLAKRSAYLQGPSPTISAQSGPLSRTIREMDILGSKLEDLTRLAIPIIEYLPKSSIHDRNEPLIGHVLAFPTLGVRVVRNSDDMPQWAKNIEWVSRYKFVDWQSHFERLREIIILPKTNRSRYLWNRILLSRQPELRNLMIKGLADPSFDKAFIRTLTPSATSLPEEATGKPIAISTKSSASLGSAVKKSRTRSSGISKPPLRLELPDDSELLHGLAPSGISKLLAVKSRPVEKDARAVSKEQSEFGRLIRKTQYRNLEPTIPGQEEYSQERRRRSFLTIQSPDQDLRLRYTVIYNQSHSIGEERLVFQTEADEQRIAKENESQRELESLNASLQQPNSSTKAKPSVSGRRRNRQANKKLSAKDALMALEGGRENARSESAKVVAQRVGKVPKTRVETAGQDKDLDRVFQALSSTPRRKKQRPDVEAIRRLKEISSDS
ncbi:hypothetical protein BT63DRAFT_441360 [Microthyrium microscopicum]|uniref:tRNA(Ile)-lysidine synthetase n=1 Tax=Microthyrium microscopicum TaxID=703497 RepID=A0A6A6U918_9PEZI|nr:hypothetical protein BT63DRAFT_441360 [Microthyrium microscopicum]